MFVCATSVKDFATVGGEAPASVMLGTEAAEDWFDSCTSAEEYARLKRGFADMCLRRFFKEYPAAKGHVAHVHVGTPTTAERFVGCAAR